ncbi:MAG: hypothetical protein R6V58_08585, partial [Planctomycetota bacterium]
MVDYAEVAPQARPGAPRKKPNRIHYLIGAIIILVGMFIAARSIYKNIAGISNSLTRVVVPGQAEIELEEAGKYTIFHEYKTTIDGSVYWSKQDLTGLRCRLLSKATGEEIPLRLPAGETIGGIGRCLRANRKRPGTRRSDGRCCHRGSDRQWCDRRRHAGSRGDRTFIQKNKIKNEPWMVWMQSVLTYTYKDRDLHRHIFCCPEESLFYA